MVHRDGFTELAPGRNGERSLNIIFVHGLRGHPQRTWEDTLGSNEEQQDEPKKIKGYKSFFSKSKKKQAACDHISHVSTKSKVFWPEDFLAPDLPQARIWTYGYNADVVGFFQANNRNSIPQHGKDLANRLESQIDNKDPIVFVAHSLGGIIVKDAMHKSKVCRKRTKHILFLGTPHRGSEQAGWALLASNISSLVQDSNKELLKGLEVNGDVLNIIHEEFKGIVFEDRMKVYSFYEARKTRGVYGNIGKIVEDHSSKLDLPRDLEAVQSIDANHRQMARCTSRDDPLYRAVFPVLRQFAQAEPPTQISNNSSCTSVDTPTKLPIRNAEPLEPQRQHHWVVSFGRNENFVGREAIMNQLSRRIPPSANKDDCQRTAIEGLGGIGKTQIALEAMYRVHKEFSDCSVFWVSAISVSSFENAYREIGQALGIVEISEDKEDIKRLVKTALSREDAGMWLMVIDNADDMDLFFGHHRLIDYLPFSRMGSILFTTRNHEAVVRLCIPGSGTIKAIAMSEYEATELLQKSLEESQTRDVESTASLLDFLAYLPLAIKQASAYMAKTGISVAKYLEHCLSSDKLTIRMLSKDFEDQGRYVDSGNAIARTWLISFEHISRDNAVAAHYLEFLCFLSEKDIPIALLPPAGDELEAEEAIGTLKAYAFVTPRKEQDSLDVHRLVRLVMQNWLEQKGERDRRLAQVIERLEELYPYSSYANRAVWMRYLPHGQAALNLRKDFTVTEIEASLLFLVAGSLRVLGKYREAEQMLRSVVEAQERVLGREHIDTICSMHDLGVAMQDQRKHKEAEKIFRQTLKIKEKIRGREHPTTLSTMNSLANSMYYQENNKEAEQMHRMTLELREKVLGREHPDTLSSMANLALTFEAQGKYKEAEVIRRQTLNLREKVLGKEHPDTIYSMNNLANGLNEQYNCREAEQLHRQALKLGEKVLGEEHPDTLTYMGNLANTLDDLGNYNEAERIHRQTTKLIEKVLGREHPYFLSSMSQLGSVLDNQGRYEEAEQIHRQVIKLGEEELGKEHYLTLQSVNNLAVVLCRQGRYAEAEQILSPMVKLEEMKLGKEHPITVKYTENLAIVLIKLSRYGEAEQKLRYIVSYREKELGEKHPKTLQSRKNLGGVLFSLGRDEQSEQMVRQALDGMKTDDPSFDACMFILRAALTEQGKHKEAEEVLRWETELKEKASSTAA